MIYSVANIKLMWKDVMIIMKKFNLTGVCVPDKHYMVDLSEKADIIIKDYIEQGAYFTVNRARQFGKTTMLSVLARRLADRYLVIRLSFEGVDDSNFNDNNSFVDMFVKNVAKWLRQMNAGQEIIDEWIDKHYDEATVTDKAFDILGDKISRLCSNAQKGVVLLVDEVDKSSDNQIFLNFLGLLRSKYLDMQEGLDTSFQSVILAGVYNVKNLKLKLHPEAERRYNSPWNIAADFDVDMSFSVDEIAKMLRQYSADTGISMDTQAVSEMIRFYTNGYPFLVSWLCKWIDERGGRQWTVQNVENAEKELLNNDNTLFDDMIKNIENNIELNQIITGVLIEGKKLLYAKSDSVINLGIMFGILAEKEKMVCISNIIFETYLYNHMIVGKMRKQYTFAYENNQFIENGKLDMERVLRKFQEVMKAEYRNEDMSFIERQGRLLFLCFMKPIINGKGNYYVEPETRDNTRMDVVISYGGCEYIVELKIWRGQKYRQEGLAQLEGYLDSRSSRKGYLVSFSFNKHKTYEQNKVILENSHKEVYEIVI